MRKSGRKKPTPPIKSSSQIENIQPNPPPILLSTDDNNDNDDLAQKDLNLEEKSNLRRSRRQRNLNPLSTVLTSEVIVEDVKKKIQKTEEEITGAEHDVEEEKEDCGESIDADAVPEIDPEEKSDNIALRKLLVEEGKEKEDCGESIDTDAIPEVDTDAIPKVDTDAIPKVDTDVIPEVNPEEKSDNDVLRKLLRGPRYFDPPNGGWGNCRNCGEAGHTIANCTEAKRKKPCFVCGSFEHNAKQCKKGKDCFICKKGGHRAKDCPEKSKDGFQKAKLCLKCGDSGHEMFTCRAVYSPSDLKEIQCYVCKSFGHLCCAKYATGAREVSCYRCGQLGHIGLGCTSAIVETPDAVSQLSCRKCGEQGHKARKCATSAKKKRKRRSGLSQPKQNHLNNNRDHIGVRSAPHDLGQARKRNKTHGQQTPSQPTHRGAWITQGPPGGYYQGPFIAANNWGSPSTPVTYIPKNSYHYSAASGYGSGLQYGPSGSNGVVGSGYGPGFQYGPSGSNGVVGSGYGSGSQYGAPPASNVGAIGYGSGFHYGASGSNGGGNGYGSGFQYGGSSSNGYGSGFQHGAPPGSNGHQQGFSAPRFGNSNNYGWRY